MARRKSIGLESTQRNTNENIHRCIPKYIIHDVCSCDNTV